ncbi:hypothetical protein [Azospirillum endophyticum]
MRAASVERAEVADRDCWGMRCRCINARLGRSQQAEKVGHRLAIGDGLHQGTGRVPWATASILSRKSCKVRTLGFLGVFGVFNAVAGEALSVCAGRGDAAIAFAFARAGTPKRPCGSGLSGCPSPSPRLRRGSPPSPGALSGSSIRLTPSAQTKFVREAGEGDGRASARRQGACCPLAIPWQRLAPLLPPHPDPLPRGERGLSLTGG